MRMTDSSHSNNDGANGSGGKRPAQNGSNGGPSGVSLPKIVKFNGNAYKTNGQDSDSPVKRPVPAHYSRDDLLSQRQALPIYPVRQRYKNFMFLTCVHFL